MNRIFKAGYCIKEIILYTDNYAENNNGLLINILFTKEKLINILFQKIYFKFSFEVVHIIACAKNMQIALCMHFILNIFKKS